MHPVLARYLNLEAAVEALGRADRGEPLGAHEQPLIDAAADAPEQRAAILASSTRGKPPPATQEALIYLAAHAAARALSSDPALHEPLSHARAALQSEGASDQDVHQFLASMILEEAFGYERESDDFDRPLFEETLKTVPELARLTEERVRQLVLMFVKSGDPNDRPLFGAAAQALIAAAWEDGPEPINPEHVETALQQALEAAEPPQHPTLVEAMRRFIVFLARSGLVGPLRQAELGHVVERLAAQVPGAGGRKN